MANNYGRIGPSTALQLLLLWVEGKHSANVAELEAWEGVVLTAIDAIEQKMSTEFGGPEQSEDLPF